MRYYLFQIGQILLAILLSLIDSAEVCTNIATLVVTHATGNLRSDKSNL